MSAADRVKKAVQMIKSNLVSLPEDQEDESWALNALDVVRDQFLEKLEAELGEFVQDDTASKAWATGRALRAEMVAEVGTVVASRMGIGHELFAVLEQDQRFMARMLDLCGDGVVDLLLLGGKEIPQGGHWRLIS